MNDSAHFCIPLFRNLFKLCLSSLIVFDSNLPPFFLPYFLLLKWSHIPLTLSWIWVSNSLIKIGFFFLLGDTDRLLVMEITEAAEKPSSKGQAWWDFNLIQDSTFSFFAAYPTQTMYELTTFLFQNLFLQVLHNWVTKRHCGWSRRHDLSSSQGQSIYTFYQTHHTLFLHQIQLTLHFALWFLSSLSCRKAESFTT